MSTPSLEPVYSLHLFRHGYDRYLATGEGYRGCWTVPASDGEPVLERLSAAGVGYFRDAVGAQARAFFFADELHEQFGAAAVATNCEVRIEPLGRELQRVPEPAELVYPPTDLRPFVSPQVWTRYVTACERRGVQPLALVGDLVADYADLHNPTEEV